MRVLNRSYLQPGPTLGPEPAVDSEIWDAGRRQRRRSLLSILFAGTAVSAIAVATLIVNLVIGQLAEDNLTRIAEENTARNAVHMQAMMRRGGSIHPAPGLGHPEPLSLELLSGPEGLSSSFPILVEGLNVIKLSLFDLNGTTVWSTDRNTIGITRRESPMFSEAVAGGISSQRVRDLDVVHLDGVVRSVDVVETYVPLRETREGKIIGVMEVYRDVANDVALQVDDVKSAVLWTTITTMGGLFLVLLGFIVVADVTIRRSNQRELLAVEEANQDLEDRVRERTRELEAAQGQLVRSEKLAAIGQLAGGVAHDLRNPLGAIRNAVYYLKRRLRGSELAQSNPRIEQFLMVIDEEVEHSNKIITDLMTFARVNAPSLSPTNLVEVIENSLAGMDIREYVRVKKRFESDLLEVLADGEQIYRVFTNLILNAQDAMPEGGELTITARRADGTAEVTFSDSGTGIADEDLKKIFEPLFTTKIKGTGLGLSNCQQIISKHGGTIEAANNPDQGATFTVRLPINADGL